MRYPRRQKRLQVEPQSHSLHDQRQDQNMWNQQLGSTFGNSSISEEIVCIPQNRSESEEKHVDGITAADRYLPSSMVIAEEDEE